MLELLLVGVTIAVVGIVLPLMTSLAQDTYGKSLEQYIVSRNPQHAGDVERLTLQYHRENERNFL